MSAYKFNMKKVNLDDALEILAGLEYRMDALANHDYDNELPAIYKAHRQVLSYVNHIKHN